jgi:hypothetical protein
MEAASEPGWKSDLGLGSGSTKFITQPWEVITRQIEEQQTTPPKKFANDFKMPTKHLSRNNS